MNRFICSTCLLAFVAVLVTCTGCSRQFYRNKADHEVYSVIRQGNNDPRWQIEDYQINPDPMSRMHDPHSPDCQPMPIDDPTAHRKMHSVGGHRGSKHWYEHGRTRHVENPYWKQFLLVNDRGEIPLDKEKAVELARLHSPEFQTALENLYLAAMNVSQERFRFDTQFYGGDSLLYSIPGRGNPALRNDVNLRAERLFATGGEWAVELANSITWTLNGQGTWKSNSSLLNVSVVQPLLRGASRKVVLERLTQSERDFLAELRRMILFQQGHYTRIVTGTAPRNTGVSGSGGGFYRLLADQIQIQNQRQNTIGLEENLHRLSEMFNAGQVDNISQVEEMRQSLLSSQSRLLELINSYQSNVEAYISSLGLPPDLKISISDPLLEQFQISSPTLLILQEDVADFLAILRQENHTWSRNLKETAQTVIRRAEGEIAILTQDLEILQKNIPNRHSSLKNLEAVLSERIANGERIDKRVYDTQEFDKRIEVLRHTDIPRNLARLQASFTLLNLIADTEEQILREMIRNDSFAPDVLEALTLLNLIEPEPVHHNSPQIESVLSDLELSVEIEDTAQYIQSLHDSFGENVTPQRFTELIAAAQDMIDELRQRDIYRDWVRRVFSVFQYELVSLSLMQTRSRLDAMTLLPVSISPEEAFQVASEFRLDWMNRKSQIVDIWRQIDITADRLKGVFDLELAGALGAIDRDRGLRFDADTGNLDVRFRWESPLTRYNEMMAYRRSQIEYQKARRDYYTYVDSVQSDLRNVLRNVQMSYINFEINRNAVLVGTIRVDVVQLEMERPPVRGGRINTNVADQLIRALEGLMRSQNDLLNTWVAYQTQRMLLDLYMGTMSLDAQGRWIDPGVIGSNAVGAIFNSADAVALSIQPVSPMPPPVPVPVLPMRLSSMPNPIPQSVSVSSGPEELPRLRLNRRYVESK